jgi:hypothetical protein
MIEQIPALAPLVTDTATALPLVGPPGGLPSPVPNFVGDLLGTIGSFLDGSVDNLDEAVRTLTPGGSGSAAGPENAPGR